MNPSGARDFALDPAAYGLPTRDDLVKLRIWDIHYHGFMNAGTRSHEENLFYVERMGIERMLSLDIAGSPTDLVRRLGGEETASLHLAHKHQSKDENLNR